MSLHHRRADCRACGGSRLRPFLSLGSIPLANSFLRSPAEFADEPLYPLDVFFCETCSLVQLLDVIEPAALFRQYLYVTGTSDTIAAHNARYARSVVETLGLQAGDLVVELGSNDGSLLKQFAAYDARTLGIDPAANIAELARANGIETLDIFFNSAAARQIRADYGPARAVIANNVLAHVDDTRDFLRGCRELLAGDGLLFVEAPYLGHLLDRLEYDTIYHEHLCYFSVASLLRLCEAADLALVRLEHVPVHGGSFRMAAGLPAQFGAHGADVLAQAEAERAAGLVGFARYERFAAEVERSRRSLVDLLARLREEGRSIAGYGAPAKTLLVQCGIDTRLLDYTVDKNPLKVGLYTPGTHIPILPLSALRERQPDYLLLLAWNFADEIIRQQAEYSARGGRFIVPIPEPRIV